MNLYSYSGPVTQFGKCIKNRWESTTYAVSEKKARSNFIYQFKQEFNYRVNTKIDIPGKITLVEEMAS